MEQVGNNHQQLEGSLDDHGSVEPILPRSAWSSNVAYLKVLFRVKRALDKVEKEAGIVR